MAEQTTPETGVSQEPLDIQQRMQNYLTQYDTDQANDSDAPQQEPVPERQAKPAKQPDDPVTEELTPEDLPGEEPAAQSAVDEFEIVHNGAQHRLPRDKVIELAQQGFDYTQKTQALAEQNRQAQERLRAVHEIEQMQPHLVQELATVTALQTQLKQYQNVDWVALAANDPLEYPKHRAQYDVLVNAYQNAVGQYQGKQQAVAQHVQRLTAQKVQQESVKLKQMLPQFNAQAAGEVRSYLINQGITESDVDRMNDAVAVSLAYKAMQYDKLSKAKAEKVKQLKTVPPMTRPGARNDTAGADQTDKLTARLKKTGDLKDAASLLLNRWK